MFRFLRSIGRWMRQPLYSIYSELAGLGECASSSLEMSVESGATGACDESCGESSNESSSLSSGSLPSRRPGPPSDAQKPTQDPRKVNPEDLEDEDLQDIPPRAK